MHFFVHLQYQLLLNVRSLTADCLFARIKHELVTIGCIKAKVNYAILLASQLASWFASTT